MMTHLPIPTRRRLLSAAPIALLAACAPSLAAKQASAASDRFASDPFRRLSEADWRARLSPPSFEVLRREGTERAFSSPLNDEKRTGVFACAGCGLPLFQSAWKYDSGTGWPSFFDVLKDNIGTKTDFKLVLPRTEYHCARCIGHQGHVFEDGPAPTGLRYCNNGVALTFTPS
jgi:peptide-methionine (R)-S-oxide reductase